MDFRRFRCIHGWFMSIATPVRLAVFCAAVWPLAIGCGRHAASSLPRSTSARAPQPIELPANIRPLLPDRTVQAVEQETRSVAVQYEQPRAPAASAGPRIVELSGSQQSTGVGAIHEPLAAPPQEFNEPPPAPPRRSEFIPIAMPEPNAPPGSPAIPELPAEPRFSVSQAPADGPHLTTPIGPAESRLLTQATPSASPQTSADRPVAALQVSGPTQWGRESIADRNQPNATANTAIDSRPLPVQPALPQHTSAMQAIAQRAMQMA